MKRLTEYTIPETGFSVVSEEKYKRILMEEKPSVEKVYNRLKKIEDILGDEYDLDRLSVMVNQCMTMREEVRERFALTAKIPLDRLRELVEADREGRCAVQKTDRKKLESAFNIVVKYGFCGDCKWIFKDKHCLECDCYQNGVRIISNALFGPEAALKVREQDG